MPVRPQPSSLTTLLLQHQTDFGSVFSFNWHNQQVLKLDLSARNPELQDWPNTEAFSAYVFSKIAQAGAVAAVGGYNETRTIYRRSAHFDGAEPRSVHLGVDVWMPAGTPLLAPLAGRVHSFRDNARFGDYGPTLILKHELENQHFYTLYGHLSRRSLENLVEGKPVEKGGSIGEIGHFPENGDWPPHLHFQVIADMQDWHGDFPGVVAPSRRGHYLQICPDPNLILQIPALSENKKA